MEVREASVAYDVLVAAEADVVPVGYKRTEVGVIPEDWDLNPLGSLIVSTDYGSSAKSNTRGDVPVLRMGNLQGGKIDWDDLVYTSDKREIEKYQLDLGDVLFNRTNTIDLVGKTSIFDGGRPSVFAGYLIRIKSKPSLLDPRFLNFTLNAEFSRKFSAKVLSVAVGQANINAQKLRAYSIPTPALAEQEAIADALSNADALIESLEQLLAKKRQIKQGTMQELLTGKKRLPGFSGAWQTKTFDDLFAISGGFSASRAQLSAKGHCYLHYGDIHTSARTFIDVRAELQDIPKLDVPLKRVAPGALLDDGDVVFVDASEDDEGTSRHVVVANPDRTPFISGLHTIVAKAKSAELDHLYLRYCFQTRAVKSQFRFFAVGTKVSGISKSNIVKVTILVPTIEEQSAIAAILNCMDAELAAFESRLAKTHQLKQGMMQELLTGRIRLVPRPAQAGQ